ncbi:MAG TPA: thioredoxin domain-containing protein [Planctomycetota bacterium]|nr:thioredoxin domain-containing protein [Planctomycetota bacterium]
MRWPVRVALVLLAACGREEPKAALEAALTPATNRLALEKSAYLRQHATNPVDWYPWGEDAFAKARAEGKPVFLSIGYSSCHWCHVMEHECFADDEVAAYLNAHFVSIKVDREERPDVDEVYMKAVVYGMRTGGGWPLSVWLTPDGKPFFGGTYFPKRSDPTIGRPGFLDLLERIRELWADPETRAKLVEESGKLSDLVRAVASYDESGPLGTGALESAQEATAEGYDAELGGFGSPPSFAPKFPGPSTIEAVLRWSLRHPDDAGARAMAVKTLARMARGGIHDHVGGGFHRYAVTRDWLVPHFEKMLYDNAQLLGLYAWAYLVTGDELFRRTAKDISQWVRREMTNAEGGFLAAQDADDPGGPEGEGGFYTWTPPEMEAILGERDAGILQKWFDVTAEGNWPERPGRSILRRKHTAEEAARAAGMEPAAFRTLLDRATERLYAGREKRPKPMTDAKVLASWNALMISGFCRAYQALGDRADLDAAVNAGRFLRKRLVKGGRVLRRWADGEAAHEGVLDDYAHLVAAWLDLYETTFDRAWLEEALAIHGKTVELFGDAEEGGFFFTAKDGEELLARGKPGFDSAIPSGNGTMAMNLLRIHKLTGDREARELAMRTIGRFGGSIAQAPLGTGALLNALDFAQEGSREIFIAGGADDPATRALVEAVWKNPDPNRVLALVTPGLEALLPPAAGKAPVKGKPAAYVCRDFACEAPVTDPAALAR